MNISLMLQHALKQMRISDAKSLEMKIGQMVRGTLIQMLDQHEGIVQIEGTPIRAMLKNTVQPGQLLTFLVDADSESGQLVLRTANMPNAGKESSIGALLKEFGQPNTMENRQLLQLLQREGVTLDRSMFQAIKQVIANKPIHVPTEQWTQATLIASNKGLPLRSDVVSSLHQVLHGPSLNKLAQTLQSQIATAFQAEGKSVPPALQQQLGRLESLLQQVQSHRSVPTIVQPVQTEQVSGPQSSGELLVNRQNSSSSNVAAALQKSDISSSPHTASAQVNQSQGIEGAAELKQVSQSLPTSSVSHQEKANWLPSLFRTLGLNLEHSIWQLRGQEAELSKAMGQTQRGMSQDIIPHATNAPEMSSQTESGRQGLDTVKTVLLQLQAMDDLPVSARETVQQALQQVTGQQLLMSTDRTSAFVQMTWVLPGLQSDDRPSAIHLQSKKKGKQGTIDAENCRLIFDLYLKMLGDTLIDVQVVDRLVSIVLHNDHPTLAMWLSDSKEMLYEALERMGYRCAKLTCAPAMKANPEVKAQSTAEEQNHVNWEYAPKTYKGVDMRI